VCGTDKRRTLSGFETRAAAVHAGRRCTFPNVIILARGLYGHSLRRERARAFSTLSFLSNLSLAVVVVVVVIVVAAAAAAAAAVDFLVSMLTHSNVGRTNE